MPTAQITGQANATMKWDRRAYLKDVVARYRVRVEGWPLDRIPIENLSDLQDLGKLEELLRRWKEGSIRFVCITEEQCNAMLADPTPWVGPEVATGDTSDVDKL